MKIEQDGDSFTLGGHPIALGAVVELERGGDEWLKIRLWTIHRWMEDERVAFIVADDSGPDPKVVEVRSSRARWPASEEHEPH